ncbi:MAG TPA: hypothetical protein VMG39_14800 [Pseudolabrys sp.]|nr:hypothetical protein [Pseudolabrys sp.]
MLRAQYIARLAGPVFAAIGIGMLANGATYREMGAQFLAGYPFIYISGVLILLAGLLILNAHHVWTRDWRNVITLLGWAMTLIGVYRIIAPQFVSFVGKSVLAHDHFFLGLGIALLALGSFLIFKGYAA